ncbi:hypothetical protein [Croceicoccus sp. YJ47]|nr:hypothetical protein [Croceicoccus sp. YJ47]QQN73827.1 hypothetical protein JD971_13800 [Croceicoccus sp. YJ47]
MHIGRGLVAAIILILAIVAYAWIDGGREETRMIEQPVALDEGGTE